MLLPAVLMPVEGGGFTALNPKTGTTSQGETIEEALANLREATELYLEEFPLKSSGQPLVTTFQVAVNAWPAAYFRSIGNSLERLGFAVVRQRGSHVVLRRGSSGCVVPNHRELKAGTLAGGLQDRR